MRDRGEHFTTASFASSLMKAKPDLPKLPHRFEIRLSKIACPSKIMQSITNAKKHRVDFRKFA